MRVAVAGTFGPLHDGHRALFETALEFGDEGVIVALTSDELAVETRHEPRAVPAFDERVRGVEAAMAELDAWDRSVEIRKLESPHGIARSEASLDALVVSPETMEELPGINDTRREAGIDPLLGIVVPFVAAADGERISSTRLVAGEIDEHGGLR